MSFSLYPEFVDIIQTNLLINKIAYSKPPARHIATKYHIVGTVQRVETHIVSPGVEYYHHHHHNVHFLYHLHDITIIITSIQGSI